MILEYAQLLSTAHRVLDGGQFTVISNGRSKKVWILDDSREDVLYAATHINHPSAIWTRQSNNNYNWLYCLFIALCHEYEYRYGKVHKCYTLLKDALSSPPNNIPVGYKTQPPPAMPDEYKVDVDSIKCYIAYYNGAKRDFCFWKNRETPPWYEGMKNAS